MIKIHYATFDKTGLRSVINDIIYSKDGHMNTISISFGHFERSFNSQKGTAGSSVAISKNRL